MATPSLVTDRSFVYAWAPHNHRRVTRRVGKWIMVLPAQELDDVWAIIEPAVLAGKLGPAAKARTGMPDVMGFDERYSIICVYTRDANNIDDVDRVYDQLRDLGIRCGLRYKTDDETRREHGLVGGAYPRAPGGFHFA